MELDGFLRERKCTTSRIPAWAKMPAQYRNLHDIDARRKLPNEVARGSLDQNLDQLRKRINIARYRKLLKSSANEPER